MPEEDPGAAAVSSQDRTALRKSPSSRSCRRRRGMLEQARPAASKVPAALAVGRGLELERVYIYTGIYNYRSVVDVL